MRCRQTAERAPRKNLLGVLVGRFLVHAAYCDEGKIKSDIFNSRYMDG
jgi:hypothetical protein